MKRIIALAAVLCLMTTAFCIVSKAQSSPTMLFEMQISGSEDGAPAVVEASEATAEYVESIDTVTKKPGSSDAPVYHTYKADEDAEEIPYITFATRTAVDSDGNPVDDVTDAASVAKYKYLNDFSRVAVTMKSGLNVLDKDNLTFEMWVRKQPNAAVESLDNGGERGGKNIFSWHNTTDTSQGIEAQWHRSMGIFVKPDKQATPVTEFSFSQGVDAMGEPKDIQTSYDDKWTHIVITREWKANLSGTGSWKSTLYVNGVNSGTKNGKEEVRTDYASTGKKWDVLGIGCIGAGANGYAFRGDIAAFRLYDGALDEQQVRDNYAAELEKYKPLVKVDAIADVEPDAENIKFTFTDCVTEGTVIDDNICIKSSEGKVLKTGTVSYDSQTREVTIPVYDFLGYGEEYTIELKNITDSVYEPIKSSGVVFKSIEKFGSINAELIGGDTVSTAEKVDVSMPISDAGDYTLVMIVLNNDRIEKVITDSTKTAGTLFVTTDGVVSLGDRYTIKAIAWKTEAEQGAVTVSRQIVLE